MSIHDLIAVLSGLAAAIALSYTFAIEPKTWEGLLLVVPALLVGGAVDLILERREDSE